MSELREILELWRSACDRREEICLATIVEVEGSSYRKPGTRMLLTSGGLWIASDNLDGSQNCGPATNLSGICFLPYSG